MAKKIPLRQCVGCREMKPKPQLIRLVKPSQGPIALDLSGKDPGRGAYLCLQESCLKRARKSRALERAFSAAITPEVYASLEESLLKSIDESTNDSQNLAKQEVGADVPRK